MLFMDEPTSGLDSYTANEVRGCRPPATGCRQELPLNLVQVSMYIGRDLMFRQRTQSHKVPARLAPLHMRLWSEERAWAGAWVRQACKQTAASALQSHTLKPNLAPRRLRPVVQAPAASGITICATIHSRSTLKPNLAPRRS